MAGYTLTTNDQPRLKIIDALEKVSEATENLDSVSKSIRDHKQTWYVKPETKSYENMAEIATAAAKEQQETVNPTRIFPYRPWDGAHATAKVLYEVWGYAGFGVTIPPSMFSPEQPLQKVTINVGPDETIDIPWGWLAVPDLKAVFKFGNVMDEERGQLFQLVVECPKLMEKAVQGIFKLIENELRQHSLYKGKAITAAHRPEFLDLSKIKPEEVIFREEVQAALEHEVWFSIENMDLMEADGQPTRWVTLLDGKYGTGKTLAILLTAKRCQEHGITFIQVRPGKDDLKLAMQTAQLYAPAVVAFEDVDTVADPTTVSTNELSQLLDTFDGAQSKHTQVQAIMSTNHSDRIQAGLLRAGRVHTYIVFSDLDAESLHRLLKVKVGERRLVNIDPDVIYRACAGYEPAFMDLVIQVARRYALSRNTKRLAIELGSKPTVDQCRDYRISTADLRMAANRLRPQHDKMKDAAERLPKPSFDKLFRKMVRDAMDGMPIFDNDSDRFGHLGVDEIAQDELLAKK